MKCPGQDTQYWNKDAIYEMNCPECGAVIEFFKDDTSRKCRGCGKRIVNPKMDFGCAAYCQYAEQCMGTLPEEFIRQREDLLKDKVAVEVKRYFKTDFKRIGHAVKVARYAEALGKKEKGNLSVILSAAYLHDIGLKNDKNKENSHVQENHEQKGVAAAREILEKLKAKEELIKEVCDIVGHHHHPENNETINFKILHDADLITNLEDENKEKKMDLKQLKQIIDKSFLTDSGREKAYEIFF
ncbi:MAG: HD domain-containing protein [Thermodesulfobacteriota bacterium]|nr:HD domain-containing protein [Thermodesulfobacteriota bacterium]